MNHIAKIETFLVSPRWLFVRIETTDGLVGWGEASLEGHAEAVDGAMEHIRDRLIGADAACIEDAWQTMYRMGFYRGGPVLMSAIAGIDQALWDIKGKRLGLWRWPHVCRSRWPHPTSSSRRFRSASTTTVRPPIF
jgi:galactonate dehydratase